MDRPLVLVQLAALDSVGVTSAVVLIDDRVVDINSTGSGSFSLSRAGEYELRVEAMNRFGLRTREWIAIHVEDAVGPRPVG